MSICAIVFHLEWKSTDALIKFDIVPKSVAALNFRFKSLVVKTCIDHLYSAV